MFRPRLLLSTSSRLFSLSAKTNKSYTPPKNVIVPNPPFAIDHSVVSSKMVMDKIKEEQQLRLGSDGRAALFARSNEHRLMPGDLVLVESLHSLSGQPLTGVASRDRITATATVSRFVGVCLSINRHGHDSNILLRNIIAGTGVEMRIPIYSPLVKSIRVVARAQKVRQARPYYLREKITKGYDLRKYLQNVGHRDPFWAPHVESVGSKGNSK